VGDKKRFLAITGICTVFCGLALFLYSWRIEPFFLHVNEIELFDESIKKNCTMVFMADLHIPLSRNIERKIIANLAAIKPDIILIGGDFSAYRTKFPLSLEKIKLLSNYGKVIMVMGNTDQCGARQCMYCSLKYPVDRLDSLPMKILRNDTIELPEFGITIFGLDDPVTNQDETTIFHLLKKSQFNILLLHSVYKLTEDQKKYFNLICSGHTHGGQIFFLKPFLHIFDPAIDPAYISGLYKVGKTTLLVSNGIGESVIPIRFGVLPEITTIHLRR
jgi:uncharacterized protein